VHDALPKGVNAMSEQEINQQLADTICSRFEWNGKQFKEGECLVLLNGEVVSITDSLSDALKALRAIEPNVAKGMVLEVAEPVIDVIRR